MGGGLANAESFEENTRTLIGTHVVVDNARGALGGMLAAADAAHDVVDQCEVERAAFLNPHSDGENPGERRGYTEEEFDVGGPSQGLAAQSARRSGQW
jgi:hypothetical protein